MDKKGILGYRGEGRGIEDFFDFVKAAAILGIYSFHFYDYFLDKFGSSVAAIGRMGLLRAVSHYSATPLQYVSNLFQALLSLGGIGVELFIIASGFGLYLSHLKEKRTWREFYKRRLLRVLPLYWTMLALFYFTGNISGKAFLHAMTLTQNFTPYYLAWGYWFISYIFLLYLAFPLLVRIFESMPAKWLFFSCSFFLTALLSKGYVLLRIPQVGVMPTQYLPYFLMGMLIAEGLHKGNSALVKAFSKGVAAVALAGWCAVIYLTSYIVEFNEGARALFAVFTLLSLFLPFSFLGRCAAFRWAVKTVAYSSFVIYLTHMYIYKSVVPLAVRAGYISAPLDYVPAGAACLLASAALAFLIQKHYDRLIERTGLLGAPEPRRN